MSGFPRFVWVLIGLLAISAGMMSLGQRDVEARPSAESYGPSGVSALAAVLQKAGYKVRVDSRSHPKIGANEIAVGFQVVGRPVSVTRDSDGYMPGFAEAVKDGSRAILCLIPYKFLDESRGLLARGESPINTGTSDKPLKLFAGREPLKEDPVAAAFQVNDEAPDENGLSMISLKDPSAPRVTLWDTVAGLEVVNAAKIGKGQLVTVQDGSFLTNRFIDRAEDATGALRLVSLLARPGETIVFTEATIGNIEDPSLVESIGPWALGGWRQLMVLGLVVIYTLGKRFGIPDESRPPQRGTRELLDGMADTYMRGKQTKAAMGATLQRVDHELRGALRLSRDASRAERDEYLPDSLKTALTHLRIACETTDKVSANEALRLVSNARKETTEFLKGGRERRLG